MTDYEYQVAVTRSRLRLSGLDGSESFEAKPDASAIETDWRTWLRAVGPNTFTGSFAPFHAEFWDWNWGITQRLKRGERVTEDDLVFFALWARGFGKSANVEWAAIAEGALIGEGYVLYVSGSQALADGHVQSIRERLESDEITKYYPHLGQPKVGKHGNQFGWRQDFLITAGGWAIRPIGLDVGVRGGRVGDLRPTLIIFDDVDNHSDSPLVVQNKLETIARSIIPAGTAKTRIFFPQNLIHRNSVANQIYTRKSKVLARRIVSGPFPAFENLEIELRQTDSGPRSIITAGTPTWADMDLAACQKFLDDSGPESFLAEYQHDFAASEQGRVIPEYDESRHVITWSQFENIFQARRIPSHWLCEVGHDVGFTSGHLSAWTWIATSAQNSRYPGLRFRYRGLTFNGIGVDEQATAIKAAMWPDEVVQRWRMSHEALSERKTYREKYKLPFQACNSAKTAGLSQWRHFLQADRTKPHPFHADTKGDDGLYVLGFPSWFDIVDDDQLEAPRDDRGLMIHRRQTIDWRYRPDILGVGGISKNEPMKADEDACLVAGTMIRTAAGERPIEDIRIGDLIWTRQGLRRCIAAGMTNPAAEVVRIKISNNFELVGTGNHLVWTADSGFCRLDSTRMSSIVSVWQSTKLSSLTESVFTAIQNQNQPLIETISSHIITLQQKAFGLCTWKSGKVRMAQFLQASKSIILTAIRSTMSFRTWNACPHLTISANIVEGGLLKKSPGVPLAYCRTCISLQFGTRATKAELGIRSTPKMQWPLGLYSLGNASTAANLSKLSLLLSGSARRVVNSVKRMAAATKEKFELVRPAAVTSKFRFGHAGCTAAVNARTGKAWHLLTCSIAWLVSTAARISKRLGQPNTARASVNEVLLQPDRAAVYNLSVESIPEYFANGVLVHNCDATRMITAMWGPGVTPLTEDEVIEGDLPESLRRAFINELDPGTADFAMIQREYEVGQIKEQRQKTRANWSHDVVDPNDDPLRKMDKMNKEPWNT